MRASIMRAGLMAGSLCTIASSIPWLSSGNCCCCAWVVLSGVFAAWVLASDSAGSASTSACAWAGWLSGGLGGVLSVPLGGLLQRAMLGRAASEQQVRQVLDALAQLGLRPPGSEDLLLAAARGGAGLELNAWTVAAACLTGATFSAFGLLGGSLGARWFLGRRPAPVPPPPDHLGAEPAAGLAGQDVSPVDAPRPPVWPDADDVQEAGEDGGAPAAPPTGPPDAPTPDVEPHERRDPPDGVG
jgi:hypothetical protein